MRTIPFLFVIAMALLFLMTIGKKEGPEIRKQAQEEDPRERRGGQEVQTLHIRYAALKPEEAPIADIIWMKKASEVALSMGTPYFNVLTQEINHQFSSKYKRNLPVVHGVIQLEDDPMKAEFDAHEIESLILSNSQ